MLRDEILAGFHRWPVIVAFALTGTLLGLVFTYFWPSSYRANVELSVELNPYRVLDDQYIPEFSNAVMAGYIPTLPAQSYQYIGVVLSSADP